MNATDIDESMRLMHFWLERIKMAVAQEWLRRAAELRTPQ